MIQKQIEAETRECLEKEKAKKDKLEAEIRQKLEKEKELEFVKQVHDQYGSKIEIEWQKTDELGYS